MRYKLICSTCGKERLTDDKCTELSSCTFDIYVQEYKNKFPTRPPRKYYMAMVGGVGAGKTYYLLSLIHSLLNPTNDLKNLFTHCEIRSFEIIDSVSDDYYNDLLEDCKDNTLRFTKDDAQKAYPINLIIRKTNGDDIEIVLFDTAGEHYEEIHRSRRISKARHDVTGTGMLYFLDPLEDSNLNKLLQSPKIIQSKDYKLVDFVFKLLQKKNGHRTFVGNPIAICVAKFDLLERLSPEDLPDKLYLHPEGVTLKNISSISDGLELFLSNKNSSTLDTNIIKDKFTTYCYFPVAPIGHDDQHLRSWANLRPKGILAPFFWVLSSLKLIKQL